MKKLSLICAIALLITQPYHIHAGDDEWTLACAPLIITTGALVLSVAYICRQAKYITTLEQEVKTKQRLIDTLTRERDAQATSVSTWHLILKKLHEYIPFLCVKESITPPQFTKLFNGIGFQPSMHKHKMPGLVTYISTHPHFTRQEKNMVSDEEDSLEERDQVFQDVDAIISGIKQKVGEF